MTRMIAPIAIAVSTSIADVVMHAIEQQPVGITTAITMAVFTGTCVLWLSTQFSKRDQDQLERFATRDRQQDERFSKLGERLVSMEQKLDDLPCRDKHCKEVEQSK